ncbi:hypothetical protein [Bacillus sp. JCM 19041]|uniref:hypothetical protein n=1 Tax=Bacillus sp. JCM 19041 TaxID=1460637 RepID=UPI0006D22453
MFYHQITAEEQAALSSMTTEFIKKVHEPRKIMGTLTAEEEERMKNVIQAMYKMGFGAKGEKVWK